MEINVAFIEFIAPILARVALVTQRCFFKKFLAPMEETRPREGVAQPAASSRQPAASAPSPHPSPYMCECDTRDDPAVM
jgi:hypothetical protein